MLIAVLLVVIAGCTRQPPQSGPEPAAAPAEPKPSELVVAVDELGPGFNPHLLAHSSPVTTALASLVLPSVFRPAADGTMQLDPTVATSATVSSANPFTVTYELNVEASWTSNAPIAAEDFLYLWERMRSEPGTAESAGYRLITDIRSRAAGKAVDVVFSRPYPQWRQLFTNLLPAHILKDAPGSWTGALTGGLPASGGPFRIASVDRGRGEIVLVRNDLYWDRPAVLDQIVLRRLDPAAMAAAIDSGDADVALPLADPKVRAALAGLVPQPHVQDAPRPVVTQLGLRADAGPLADVRVRQALAALIDREALRAAVAPDALAANAFGRAPSQPGYAPTSPPGPDPVLAHRLLTDAGWILGPDGRWSAGGSPVGLVIGGGAAREQDLRVARAVAAQLDAAGISVRVVTSPDAQLFSRPTVPVVPPTTAPPTTTPSGAAAPNADPTDAVAAAPPDHVTVPPDGVAPTSAANDQPAAGVRVDILVWPHVVSSDPAASLASAYGCPSAMPQVPDPPRLPTGFCSPGLDHLIDELLTSAPDPDLEATVERELWQQVPALPLFQPVTLVVSTPAADAATGIGPGPLATGPLTGAARWAAPER